MPACCGWKLPAVLIAFACVAVAVDAEGSGCEVGDDGLEESELGDVRLLQVSIQLNLTRSNTSHEKQALAHSKPDLAQRQLPASSERQTPLPRLGGIALVEELAHDHQSAHIDVGLVYVVLVMAFGLTMWFLRSSADSAGQGPSATDEASFFTLYFIVFMDAFGFGIFAPYVPVLSKTFNMSARNIAGLLTAFSFAQAFLTPLFGYLSDRIGRRKVLLLAVAGEVAAFAALSCARSFHGLLVGYTLAGAFSATIGVCNAYIADITDETERPVRVAHVNGSIALGILVGPVVGAVISNQGFVAACRVCALLSATNWAFACFCLGVPNKTNAADEASAPESGEPQIPGLAWLLCLGAFLGEAGLAAWESCAALYIMDSYFWSYPSPATSSSQFYAGSMAFCGVTVIFVTVFLFPFMMRVFEQWYTVAIGTAFRLSGLVGIAFAPTKWFFLAAQGLQNIGDNLGSPNQTSLLTEVAGPSAYGTCLGAMSAFQAMARVLGPVVFASLYEDVHHSAPWLAVAALGTMSCSIWFYVYANSRELVAKRAASSPKSVKNQGKNLTDGEHKVDKMSAD
ncbi:Tetracycline resistance protein, class A [Symbiodinium microadriaticum]|uniref:Tetracycline resistance protein, class A n=1 Tax=Symbiodinium microadriaticum TaxID=2951 RepID=A0A1Q9C3D5_SYMMI|nr:Tetracycline resistance protein, class A [Symbiodinium microadriaticum]